jgi:acyl-[acyl carrier protein]--UDP-N-acetylglucosamine O-acyltransferase
VDLPSARARLSSEIKMRFPAIPWPVIVDPSAHVGRNVDLGEVSIVAVRAVLTVNISIGKFTQVNFSASIGHETTIRNCCVVNPGADVTGGVVIGDEVIIGSNSTTLQYISVGAGPTVGAGAVVTKDIAPQLRMIVQGMHRPMRTRTQPRLRLC